MTLNMKIEYAFPTKKPAWTIQRLMMLMLATLTTIKPVLGARQGQPRGWLDKGKYCHRQPLNLKLCWTIQNLMKVMIYVGNIDGNQTGFGSPAGSAVRVTGQGEILPQTTSAPLTRLDFWVSISRECVISFCIILFLLNDLFATLICVYVPVCCVQYHSILKELFVIKNLINQIIFYIF